MMAMTISCRSVSPSTVSARVGLLVDLGVLLPDAVSDDAVVDGGELEIQVGSNLL